MRLSRIRVGAGYLLFALVFLLARPSAASLALAAPLAVVGEAIRLWASGHIEKTRALATGGPYAHTRNPLYLGSVLLALAVGVASASAWSLAAVVAYFAAFYPAIVREEAGFLRRTFGAAYAAWAAEVPLLLPRLSPGGPRATRFSWARVSANREWRTLIALPCVLLLLALRGWLPF
ncbi:MAG: isoprenylcysteine carboxylmethyltransferase family protein [Vicinamibacteria bacterium]